VFSGNRLYIVAVASLMVALLVASLMLELNAEARVANIKELATAQQRKSDVALYVRTIVDAETGQRGYLLTRDPIYLVPYEAARSSARPTLDRIIDNYMFEDKAPPSGNVRDALQKLRQLGTAKMDELAASLTLEQSNRHDAALELVRTDYGLQTMDALRKVAADLDAYENARIEAATEAWRGGISASRALVAGSTLLNMALLAFAAFLLHRDLRRRDLVALQQEQHNQELAVLVHLRTEELSALSSHLQTVAEREKAALARELHDELGGIMVAAKMDVAWLERRLSRPDDELKVRWTRLRKLLDDGVDMKRRVVEALRPTLLDNMGIVPAVRWVYSETCARAGIKCTESYPDDDLKLADEAAIAVFRVVQESLTNIVKHSKATESSISITIDSERLKIRISDNGMGLPITPKARRGQGLAGMRHRVASFGGTWRISTPESGGTLIEVSLPLERVLPTAAAAENA
jgi:signal transduction histidine kinase